MNDAQVHYNVAFPSKLTQSIVSHSSSLSQTLWRQKTQWL